MANQPTILILEDDADLREAVTMMFETHGFKCIGASAVDEAVRALDATHFDAVITDIHLQGRSGLEFLRIVRCANARLPVFLMSGALDMDSKIATELGATGFIEKPVVTRKFIKQLLTAIAKYNAYASALSA